ncbi:hypothetical protein HW555_007116, partial [Spodoptera exigua]
GAISDQRRMVTERVAEGHSGQSASNELLAEVQELKSVTREMGIQVSEMRAEVPTYAEVLSKPKSVGRATIPKHSVLVSSDGAKETSGDVLGRVRRALDAKRLSVLLLSESMDSDIVVREATPQDLAVRTELVRCSIVEYDLSAFFMLFFQELESDTGSSRSLWLLAIRSRQMGQSHIEMCMAHNALTLHVCVLGGAVVFIFLGGGPGAAAALLLGVAALLAGGAALAHRAAAARLAARLPAELYGCVAERRGRVLGTASVAECWGPRRSGWLQALAVAPGWRRRGVARALLAAARARAAAEGLESLEAAASQLQAAATGLLHSAGWEMRGSYHRPLLGAALTLPMTRMGLELPHAVDARAPYRSPRNSNRNLEASIST